MRSTLIFGPGEILYMPVSPESILRHEFVGMTVEIAWSKNPDAVGLAGRVVDETRNMLTLKVGDQAKTFPKEECIFIFTLPSGERVRVEGKLLVSRSEDRIKKKQKKW